MKKKNGFSTVELLVSFVIISFIAISMFRAIILLNDKLFMYVNTTKIIVFKGSITNYIESDLNNNILASYTNCGANCYDLTYNSGEIRRLKIDTTNKTIQYGSMKKSLPSDVSFNGNISISNNTYTVNSGLKNNSILNINIPLMSDVIEGTYDIKVAYQYNAALLGSSSLASVDVLVVAGGGGGGALYGGGGGAGGVIYMKNYAVSKTTYIVTVGDGGYGGQTGWGGVINGGVTISATSGENSVFGPLVAYGGGWGGFLGVASSAGQAGGSGGGSWGASAIAQGIAGQGNRGGNGSNNTSNYDETSGGGGGAGSVGFTGGAAGSPGNGGNGLLVNISGTDTYYGGGGGAGCNKSGGNATGGIGGGGAGGTLASVNGGNGTANTGGGGGGGGATGTLGTVGLGGRGGSGIVIIRYLGSQKATGGTITNVNGYTIHTYKTIGSATFTVW